MRAGVCHHVGSAQQAASGRGRLDRRHRPGREKGVGKGFSGSFQCHFPGMWRQGWIQGSCCVLRPELCHLLALLSPHGGLDGSRLTLYRVSKPSETTAGPCQACFREHGIASVGPCAWFPLSRRHRGECAPWSGLGPGISRVLGGGRQAEQPHPTSGPKAQGEGEAGGRAGQGQTRTSLLSLPLETVDPVAFHFRIPGRSSLR